MAGTTRGKVSARGRVMRWCSIRCSILTRIDTVQSIFKRYFFLPAAHWRSMRVLARQHHFHRARDYPQIQPQRPVAQVIEVEMDARFHLVERFRLAP